MKSPAFRFYPTDYLASQRVQMLTLEEEGAYLRLLCYCWQHGSIPDDPVLAARLIGKGASTTLATVVQAMFEVKLPGGRLTHDRLEAERAKQAEWSAKSSAGGRKSAQSRKGGSRVVEGCLENGCDLLPTKGQHSVSVSVSSSSIDTHTHPAAPPSDPVTEEIAWKFARNLIGNPQWTKAAVQKWHAHRAANGWTRTNQAGAVTVINSDNWQADLRASHSWATILPKGKPDGGDTHFAYKPPF